MKKNDTLRLILGLGCGVLVGAGAALLLAPVSGKEARAFIAKNAVEPIRSKFMGMQEELKVNIAEFAPSQNEPELARRGKTAGRQSYPGLEA